MKKNPLLFCFVLIFTGFVSAQTNQSASCPTVQVRGGGVAHPNETTYFTADVDKKGAQINVEYVWSVRGGKIIKGQGMETIEVKVSESGYLSATIEIEGFPEGCSNTSTESVIADDLTPKAVKIGEFSTFNTQAEKALLEKLKNELQRDTTSQIYVIDKSSVSISDEKMKQKMRKIGRLLMTRLNVEGQRITLRQFNRSDREYMEIWLVPLGAEIPKP